MIHMIQELFGQTLSISFQYVGKPTIKAVPELTRSADIKPNERLSLQRRESAVRSSHRTFPGPTAARPVEHFPAGCLG
jgi:hypothetical protein